MLRHFECLGWRFLRDHTSTTYVFCVVTARHDDAVAVAVGVPFDDDLVVSVVPETRPFLFARDVESLVVPIVVDAVNWKFPSWFDVGPVGW